jgi:four helix bundle protein
VVGDALSSHRELIAWREALRLARMTYEATELFPKAEQFGLTLQLRRAAVSVASNIAEGAARNSRREFVQFLSISLGSLAEMDTQIELAESLGWLTQANALKVQRRKVAQLTTKLRQACSRGPNGSRITDHGSRR